MLLSITFFTDLNSQCQQFQAVYLSNKCSDNGTINDPSDDTYTAQVYVSHDNYPSNTWSSSDGSYINEPYNQSNPIYQFGPYPISGGNVSFVVTDDQNNCSSNVTLLAPPTCSEPPFVCPDFDLCYQLIDSASCSATYLVNINGDLSSYNNINNLFFEFSASLGTIDNVAFLDPLGYFYDHGVQISGNAVSGGSGMNGEGLITNYFVVTVSALPGQCVSLSHSPIVIWFGANPCVVQSSSICPLPAQYCATGNEVSGNVTAPAQFYDCPDTQNHGIEGVSMTVVSANGDTCTTRTANDGTYSCVFCDDGPFNICAEADCPDPCGVTDIDLVLLRKYVLGVFAYNKDIWFIGDVDTNKSISTLDLVRLQREILGLDTNFIKNWCRFVPVSDYASAPNPNDTNAGTSYQAIDNCVSTANGGSTDFLRYMVGDVDGSCTDCIYGDEQGSLGLVAEDSPGSFKLKIPSQQSVQTFTLHLNIPLGTQVTSINSPLQGLQYSQKGNELHIIWIDESTSKSGYSASVGETIIEISYTGLSSPTMIGEENWLLNSVGTIYKLETDRNVEGRSKKSKVVNVNNFATFEIDDLGKSYNISITDILGRVLYSSTTSNGEEYYTINTKFQSGIYMISISDGVFSQTKKVFINN